MRVIAKLKIIKLIFICINENKILKNKGIMACPKEFTEDGFESQFGTNHIGHFALTVGLLPALKEAAKITGKNARVVSLSSLAHARSNVDFADVNFKTREYDPWVSYGQSKTANVLFSVGLTQRYAKDGIYSNAVMPGGNIISNLFKFHSKKFHSFYLYQGIMTNLQKNVPREEQIKRGWIDENGNIDSRFKTVEQGASTSIFAAVALELENKGGLYLEDCREADRKSIPDIFKTMAGYNEYATDPDAANRLWELSEKLIQN